MIKRALNQNAKFVQEFTNTIEPDFVFNNKPIDRFKDIENSEHIKKENKTDQISELREKIYSIDTIIEAVFKLENKNNLIVYLYGYGSEKNNL